MEGPNYTSVPASTPYIYPTGILNAGSFVPFTAQLAPGEFISIFGANLSTTTASDPSLPTGLGGVQVLVNGSPAAVRYVSPSQINAVVPLGIDTAIASIQVVNSLGTSNTVTNYVGLSQPGIFNSVTSEPAILHADGTIVSAANPAVTGEELEIYLTGLGPLESSGNATYLPYISVGFSGVAATIDYAGIEPGTPLAVGAGYQMNVTVPSGANPGWNYLGIGVPSCFNYEVLICVTRCDDASLRSSVRSRSARAAR